jgi:hypothetical protein
MLLFKLFLVNIHDIRTKLKTTGSFKYYGHIIKSIETIAV